MGPFPNHLYLNLYLIDWKCYSAPCVMHYVYYVPWGIICQCWSALLRHLANAETPRVSASQPEHCWARYRRGNIRAGLEARPAIPGRCPVEQLSTLNLEFTILFIITLFIMDKLSISTVHTAFCER